MADKLTPPPSGFGRGRGKPVEKPKDMKGTLHLCHSVTTFDRLGDQQD